MKQLLRAEPAERAVRSPLPGDFPRTSRAAGEMIPGQRSIGSRAIPDDQTDHLGSYSYLWWTNGVDRAAQRHWPDAPLDTFGAFGHGGREAMVVMPRLGLIASWNDSSIQSLEMERKALAALARTAAE